MKFDEALKEAEELFKPASSEERDERFIDYFVQSSGGKITKEDLKILKIPVTLTINAVAVPFKSNKNSVPFEYLIEYSNIQRDIEPLQDAINKAVASFTTDKGFSLSVDESYRLKLPRRFDNFDNLTEPEAKEQGILP